MPPEAAGTYICIVCGEPAAPNMSSDCNWCNGRFHLNQRNDVQAKDCGQVWIDEQYLALQFACNDCLARDDAAPSPAATPASPAGGPAGDATRRRRYRRRA